MWSNSRRSKGAGLVGATRFHCSTQLPVGLEVRGPAMVEDDTTTALVHPGQTLEVDEAANLVVWLG